MGLFGSLIGWDQTKDAHNAVLANYLVSLSDRSLKRAIATSLVKLMRDATRHQDLPQNILDEVSGLSRIKQMNFVAISCIDAGIPSPIPGVEFAAVRNPYRSESESSLSRIGVAVSDLSRRAGVRLAWPGNEVRENLSGWLGGGGDLFEVSTELAHTVLLRSLLDLEIVRAMVEECQTMTGLKDPFDLALVTAECLFLHNQFKYVLSHAQLSARMIAFQWHDQRKASPWVVEEFVSCLNDIYSGTVT